MSFGKSGRRRDHEHVLGYKMAAAPSDLRGTLGREDDEEEDPGALGFEDEPPPEAARFLDDLRRIEAPAVGLFDLEVCLARGNDVQSMRRVLPGERLEVFDGLTVESFAGEGRWRVVADDRAGWDARVFPAASGAARDERETERLDRGHRVEATRGDRLVLVRPVAPRREPRRRLGALAVMLIVIGLAAAGAALLLWAATGGLAW